ncbi:AIPR family protein [Bradyrhizobium cosmicum]|uniref:AIPR family protein n=1 Tax=Bradyrhizobium cosmicum TaxID=1404864 RepID=UPI0028E7F0D0|nr:AIPR family protein [Bradyrhizobium cosmicum]
MRDKVLYPTRQKENLLRGLLDDLNEAKDQKGLTYYAAFREVALSWLGYSEDQAPIIIDGANDRGFDAYRISRSEIDLFQFKSQDFQKKSSSMSLGADGQLLADIPRIVSFLQSADFSKEAKNRKLKAFVGQLQTALRSVPDEEVVLVRLNLIILFDGLTTAARNELELHRKQNGIIKILGRDVVLEIDVYDVDRLLASKWRETNSQWVDATGQHSEWLTFHYQSRGSAYINDKTTLILYVRARDLIDAYRRFGYQIFEANVRCEITKSQVNDAIRQQVATEKGIDEFKLLNNGITIICVNRKQPNGGRLDVMQPQIVNGLQTVTSLFEAYDALSAEMQEYFDDKCFVLVRIYDQQSIPDVPKLVRATNNQNKMEQRNLRSNDPDQISFEREFAKLTWFYERKDFAWTAFERSPNQWTTLKKYKDRDFKVAGRQGRPTIRRVDNQDIGQHWLAFIGHVDDAAQRRRLIFDNDKYYARIFQSRVSKPAFDYQFQFNDPRAEEETVPSAPSAEALLLAHLTYRLAKENVLTSAKVREKIIADRRFGNLSDDEIDQRLTKDPDYIKGLALSAGTFLFTELCGFLFLRAFGLDLYSKAALVLLNHTDMEPIYRSLNFETIKQKISGEELKPNDLFAMLWLLFENIVLSELAESDQWRNAFFTESSKPRIMYRESTRRRLLDRVVTLDEISSKRPLNYPFSVHFDKLGIVNHIKRIVKSY